MQYFPYSIISSIPTKKTPRQAKDLAEDIWRNTYLILFKYLKTLTGELYILHVYRIKSAS